MNLSRVPGCTCWMTAAPSLAAQCRAETCLNRLPARPVSSCRAVQSTYQGSRVQSLDDSFGTAGWPSPPSSADAAQTQDQVCLARCASTCSSAGHCRVHTNARWECVRSPLMGNCRSRELIRQARRGHTSASACSAALRVTHCLGLDLAPHSTAQTCRCCCQECLLGSPSCISMPAQVLYWVGGCSLQRVRLPLSDLPASSARGP